MNLNTQQLVEFRQEVEEAALPDILCATDFLAEDLPLPAELVSGLLHQGTLGMLAGASKSMKSWILTDLAISVAAGKPFWDRATAQGGVLLINPEIQAPFMQHRLASIASAKRLRRAELGALQLLNLRGFRGRVAGLVEGLKPRCEGLSLIILDSIYRLIGSAQENAAGEMAEFLGTLDKLSHETGAALVFGHHFAKGNAAAKESIDRASGSGVFARYPDTLLMLMHHEKQDCFVVEPTLRNFPPAENCTLEWQHPLMLLRPDLDPSQVRQVGGRKRTWDLPDILEVLEPGMDKAAWKRVALTVKRNGKPMAETTFRRLYDEAVAAQIITEGIGGALTKTGATVSFQRAGSEAPGGGIEE